MPHSVGRGPARIVADPRGPGHGRGVIGDPTEARGPAGTAVRWCPGTVLVPARTEMTRYGRMSAVRTPNGTPQVLDSRRAFAQTIPCE